MMIIAAMVSVRNSPFAGNASTKFICFAGIPNHGVFKADPSTFNAMLALRVQRMWHGKSALT
eukprot:397341-Amphidinium_carterae.2